ncbi:hypothetical protein OCB03_22915 [Bacillus cereus]|nr:hypothetical protein [Bacillus cereus]
MPNETFAEDIEEVRTLLLNRIQKEPNFFCELLTNPERTLSALNISNEKIKSELLEITPEKVFDKTFKMRARDISCIAFTFGC